MRRSSGELEEEEIWWCGLKEVKWKWRSGDSSDCGGWEAEVSWMIPRLRMWEEKTRSSEEAMKKFIMRDRVKWSSRKKRRWWWLWWRGELPQSSGCELGGRVIKTNTWRLELQWATMGDERVAKSLVCGERCWGRVYEEDGEEVEWMRVWELGCWL